MPENKMPENKMPENKMPENKPMTVTIPKESREGSGKWFTMFKEAADRLGYSSTNYSSTDYSSANYHAIVGDNEHLYISGNTLPSVTVTPGQVTTTGGTLTGPWTTTTTPGTSSGTITIPGPPYASNNPFPYVNATPTTTPWTITPAPQAPDYTALNIVSGEIHKAALDKIARLEEEIEIYREMIRWQQKQGD